MKKLYTIKKNYLANRHGFTLVEVLVALSVFTIAVLVIIQLFPAGIQSVGLSTNEISATNLAQAALENAKGAAYDEVESKSRQPISTDPNNPFSRFDTELIVEYIDSNLNPAGSDLGLKKITVIIYWQDMGLEKNVTASYIKNR